VVGVERGENPEFRGLSRGQLRPPPFLASMRGPAMLDGPSVAAVLKDCGVTHVVWLPDSEIGLWESALSSTPGLTLLRVCREGEAFALAGGLWLGGKTPIVMLQCTGLFEAGDSLRNIVYDLKIPLFFLVGVRSYYAHQKKQTADTCPVYTEPILRAWNIPFTVLDKRHSAADLAWELRQAQAEGRAGAVLLAE
jgi:sulfopyruvate decarboxylase subunit alpha